MPYKAKVISLMINYLWNGYAPPFVCLFHIIFLLLKVPRTLIADSLHIAVSTISKKKHRLAHSMGVETNQLQEYLVNFCLGMHDDTTNYCYPTQSIDVF